MSAAVEVVEVRCYLVRGNEKALLFMPSGRWNGLLELSNANGSAEKLILSDVPPTNRIFEVFAEGFGDIFSKPMAQDWKNLKGGTAYVVSASPSVLETLGLLPKPEQKKEGA